jgi:glyoxylase-like metal-dependent hydrolase (beta-lactamase superfamily II)
MSSEHVDRVPQGVERIRAANASLLTLSGTNTYLVGEPAYVIDPGPDAADHVAAVWSAAEARGGIAGIALTHSHLDHAQSAMALRARSGAPLAVGPRQPHSDAFQEPAADGLAADVVLVDGARFGPLEAIESPGHAADHFCFRLDSVLFSGDAVLGEGSVFIPPGGGGLARYLESLRRLQTLELTALCPGHGPVVWDPDAKLREYVEHRLDRESRLLSALERGLRGRDELLDDVWDDAPTALRPAAALTLEAHLDKLEGEGRLPPGVERLRL